MSAVRPGCLAAGRRLGSRRFAAKHTQARGHALAWLRPDAPASQLARPTDAGFRHAHRRAASHLTAAHLPAPPAPPSREGGTCSSRPFGPRGHASAFASMSSAPPCRGRHVPHGHLRSHGDSWFALPHVLRAPQRGGRHVPHGHLESHGDYTFALPHVLFVTGRFAYWLANLQTPTQSSITLMGHTKLLQPTHFHDDSSEHMTPMCSRCRDALSASDIAHPLRRGPERCLRHAGSGALRPGMMGLPGWRRAERFTTVRPRRAGTSTSLARRGENARRRKEGDL